MRIVSVVGARPQFIKATLLSRILRERHEERLVHTGQHYDVQMSGVFFQELNLPEPDVNLGIGGLSNVEQVGQMLLGLQPLIEECRPDWILVYGDTNSTLAGALAGRLLNVRVAHVEAGLRSYNAAMPEETNRVLTDHVSSALFCPTSLAVANLEREGIGNNVFLVGDVMIDVLLKFRDRAGQSALETYALTPRGYYLATIHRASNTDNPAALASIMAGFARLPEMPILVPAHPRLRKALETAELRPSENVRLIDPVGYVDMVGLTGSARIVLTDSGGLQKEAYALGVPCLTLREETEWVETVESGWNQLVGADSDRIEAGVQRALASSPAEHPDLYGDGRASERIAEILTSLK